jgi:LmbE family N-acetylglucosaminyl deacetylase
LKILCLGAHCDDIPIGCGGTLLHLATEYRNLEVAWAVLSSNSQRKKEEEAAAHSFLEHVEVKHIVIKEWRDGFLPYCGIEVKEFFEELKLKINPDLILTHYRHDRHQDHRVVSDLTWNTFRRHFILEYEIPKYDGDMGSPNVFVPLEEECCREKIKKIVGCYSSQAGHRWFTEDTFLSLARLRGMETPSSTSYAEAFYCRKLLLA